jgi:Fic family protein
MPRQGDLDGRGNLSERALIEFLTWFLRVCLDQIRFMSGMFDLAGLADRLKAYAAMQGWRAEAGVLLAEVLRRGEIARGEAAGITALGERTVRGLLGTLVDHGVLGSDTPKGAVSLRFPVKALDVLFPRLFPEA